MGKGIVDKLKTEFDIKDEWINIELHPETPPGGVLKSVLFPGYPLDRMDENLNKLGAPYGISFGRNELLSNSRKALEAGELAWSKGKFGLFHEKVFQAYFVEGRDIGKEEELIKIAIDCGLDTEELKAAWKNGFYLVNLEKSNHRWRQLQVTGIPTFVFDGKEVVVGAQPIDEFRKILRNLEKAEM